MAEGFKTYKKKEWWREDGEVSESERRIKESSDKRKQEFELKAGSDGKNVPSITTKYSPKAGRKKVAETKLTVKKYVEADGFGDEDEYEDEDMGMDADMDVDMDDEVGINDEMDVPAEAEAEMGGDAICTCPACGAKLVIEAVPEEEGMEDEMGDEDMEDMGDEPDLADADQMGAESEEDDMTVPKLESKKDKFNRYMKKMESKKQMESEESFEEAYQKWKSERKRRIEAIKNKTAKHKTEAKSEIGVEYGTSTAKVVGSGKTFDGNKTDVGKGNDDDVGITSSSTGDMVGAGKTFAGSKSSISSSGARSVEKSKAPAKKRVAEEQAAVTDPFEDDDDLEGMIDGEDYADLPLDVGADSDSISKYESVKERRKNRGINESTTKEAFDFKMLVRGKYK